jgi:Chaperone of endosialidase
MRKVLIVTTIILLISSFSAFSDIPHLITYQGRLTDDMGVPVADGGYDLTFTIYDDSTSGTALWSETHGITTESGLFNVQLGSSISLDDSIFALNPDLFIGMLLSASGTEMSPRARVTSSAFSFHSLHADTAAYALSAAVNGADGWVDDGSVVRLETIDDSVGIGTSTPSAKLDVNGDVVITGRASIGLSNTNTGAYGFVVGAMNEVTEETASVTGGSYNVANAYNSHIGGGMSNFASGMNSTIGGGTGDSATSSATTIAGGANNVASGMTSSIGGGLGNRTMGNATVIAGGRLNTAQQNYSTIAGGDDNTTIASYSFIGGGYRNYAHGEYSTIAGGSADTIIDIGDYGFIGGGESNLMWGNHGVIAGGSHHFLGGEYSAILGGFADTISGYADYSYLFGINSNLDEDSTFMVDMPHIVFGDQSTGYEFPDTRGADGQMMVTDANGQLSWSDPVNPNAAGWVDDGTVVRLATGTDKVGIGTSNPSAKLTVNGDGVILGKTTFGVSHTNNGDYATISGGYGGFALGSYAVVSGGNANHAEDHYSTVSGGTFNWATGHVSTVGGGALNKARGDFSTVAGGGGPANLDSNYANGNYATVPGGRSNGATGHYSFAAGYRAKAIHEGAFVWADYTDADFASTANNQFLIRASGGAVIEGKTTFGVNQTNSGDYATITGGAYCHALDNYAVVCGGISNRAESAYTIVGGGSGNRAEAAYSTIVGGFLNKATEVGATISGGAFNKARGQYSVIGGGGGSIEYDSNYAIGNYSTVPGGRRNGAVGDHSFAAGYRAKADHEGAFVWADYTSADFASTGVDQFLIRAGGGVGIGLTSPKGLLDITDNADGIALHISSADRDIVWQTGQSLQLGDWNGSIFNPRMRINSNGNVGVNTTAPNGALHVKGNTDGVALHLSNASGDITWPTDNTLNIGTWSGTVFDEHMRITAGGNVGIGVTSTPNILTIVRYSSTDPIADAWTTWSSRRWKENIQPLEDALDKVQRLRGVSFDWKETGKSDIGLIAEEVGEVVPEVVAFEDNGIDAQSVEYARLVALLIESIKEQQVSIIEQQQSIENLELQVTELKSLIESQKSK